MGTPPHRTVTAFIPLTGYKTEILLTVIPICKFCLYYDCRSVYYSSQSAEEMYDILSIMKMYACITAENMSK